MLGIKMTEHFVIDVLSKDECSLYAQTIDSLSSEWIKRPQWSPNCYTLGSATHADIDPDESANSNLFDDIEYNNNILIKNFPDLYKKILKALGDIIGECELIVGKAPIPGFFIYGEPKPNNIKREEISPLRGACQIHFDGQVPFLDYIWNNYRDVDTESISYTLAIEMPEYETAFLLWDQPDLGYYMKGEIAEIYKGYDYYEREKNSEFLDSIILNKIPGVIQHIPGKMIVHKGHQLHAAAGSIKPFSTDRRITLQGFGVKCDGIWRLFF
jgi:hypothetical protein